MLLLVSLVLNGSCYDTSLVLLGHDINALIIDSALVAPLRYEKIMEFGEGAVGIGADGDPDVSRQCKGRSLLVHISQGVSRENCMYAYD